MDGCTAIIFFVKQFWHALHKWLLSSHPWPNMNNQCTIWKKNKYAIMYWNQFCYIYFSILRNFESNRGFLLCDSIELILKTWKTFNFDMFYKNDCWAVICYPICVTNVSYERKIIILSFPVISLVILIFVFLRFEIKSGFPFFFSHCAIGLLRFLKLIENKHLCFFQTSTQYCMSFIPNFSFRFWYCQIIINLEID